jgi:type II secretory pathway pseudopilin PulG
MKHHSQSGITLFEMVIVVGIVGTLLGLYLSFYKPTQDARATAQTKIKIEKVLDQLSAFALRNGYLPCPAQFEIAQVTGVEYRNNSASWPTHPDQPSRRCENQYRTSSDIYRGIIPYSTLGLSQEDAKDGFGRYMSYLVWRNASETTTTSADHLSSAFCNGSISNLQFYRNNRNMQNLDRPVVAIISYGPEGIGGYNMSAGNATNRRDPLGSNSLSGLGGSGSNTGERRNAVDQNTDRIDLNDYSQQANNNHFDDIIGYMTKQGVITRLGLTYCGATP